MIKVSIIVAVYNVEEHLEKCLDSLLGQDLEEIEIIAVNDGSTDSSPDILRKYADRSDKLIFLTKTNGGAADARNYGLKFAKGEYIGYVDSDDFVDSDMYGVMYAKAKEQNSDIVECNLRHTYANGEDVEVMARYYKRGELLCFGRYVVWNKIYNREWLLKASAHFPKGLIYEDVAFVAKLVPYINGYAYVDIAPVHYVQRLSSVNNSTSEKTMHIFAVLQDVMDFYKKNNFYGDYKTELEYLYTRILLCSSFYRMCRMGDRALRKKALDGNWRLLAETFPGWRKNPALKMEKSRQARFMKTVNAFTYKIYGALLPVIHAVKIRLSRKWKQYEGGTA